jgi:hypothetical protein
MVAQHCAKNCNKGKIRQNSLCFFSELGFFICLQWNMKYCGAKKCLAIFAFHNMLSYYILIIILTSTISPPLHKNHRFFPYGRFWLLHLIHLSGKQQSQIWTLSCFQWLLAHFIHSCLDYYLPWFSCIFHMFIWTLNHFRFEIWLCNLLVY